MSAVFLGLSAPEFSAIAVGLCGLVFSVASYRRALSAEQRAQRAEDRTLDAERRQLEIQVATEKDLAQVEAHTVRSAADWRLWRIRTTRTDAKSSGATPLVEILDDMEKSVREAFAPYDEVEKDLPKFDPKTATHNTLRQLKEIRTKIRKAVADEKLYDDQVETMIVSIRTDMKAWESRLGQKDA